MLLARLRQGVHGEDAGHRAADLLYDRVLPFYEALGVKIRAIITDNGREYCGIHERHPYELLLAMEDIEHRTTKIRSPRTNGFVGRMNRTLLDECFRVQRRQTWYIGVDEIPEIAPNEEVIEPLPTAA